MSMLSARPVPLVFCYFVNPILLGRYELAARPGLLQAQTTFTQAHIGHNQLITRTNVALMSRSSSLSLFTFSRDEGSGARLIVPLCVII